MRELKHNEHITRCYDVLDALTPAQLARLWNGVGSGKPVLSLFKPPHWVRELFAEASKFHDIAYQIGGTGAEQDVVDREFAELCFDAAMNLGWLKRWYALLWLKTNDDILRNFGSLAFTHRIQPCYDITRLLLEAA